MCANVSCLYVCYMHHMQARGAQKRASDPLKLEGQLFLN